MMSPAEIVLLCVAFSGVLVALGYWAGRTSQMPKAMLRHRSLPQPEAQRRQKAPALAVPTHAPMERSERLQREVQTQVQALRKAREAAAPWTPPAVDRVDLSHSEATYAAWFADTTVEPHVSSRARAPATTSTFSNVGTTAFR
jgi:hypothetical protein